MGRAASCIDGVMGPKKRPKINFPKLLEGKWCARESTKSILLGQKACFQGLFPKLCKASRRVFFNAFRLHLVSG